MLFYLPPPDMEIQQILSNLLPVGTSNTLKFYFLYRSSSGVPLWFLPTAINIYQIDFRVSNILIFRGEFLNENAMSISRCMFCSLLDTKGKLK